MIPQTRSDPEPRWIERSEGPVSVIDVGRGPAVIALHGMPGSTRDFRYLGAVVEGPLRLVRIDLPGFGLSPGDGGDAFDLDAAVRVVLDVMDALDIHRAALLGHSFGGVIATAVTAAAPERVLGLALLATPGLRPHQRVRGLLRLHPLFAVLLPRASTRRLAMPLLRRMWARFGFPPAPDEVIVRSVLAPSRALFEEHAERLEQVDVPALVAWTEDDRLIEGDIPAEVGAILPEGPRLVFAEGGHNLQKSHAVEIGESLVRWVPTL